MQSIDEIKDSICQEKFNCSFKTAQYRRYESEIQTVWEETAEAYAKQFIDENKSLKSELDLAGNRIKQLSCLAEERKGCLENLLGVLPIMRDTRSIHSAAYKTLEDLIKETLKP